MDPAVALLYGLLTWVVPTSRLRGWLVRAYSRQRQMLVRYAAAHVQHMQKALEQMNVKLTEVMSDITGPTGISIIDAILRGQRNPKKLAKLRARAAVTTARRRLPLR